MAETAKKRSVAPIVGLIILLVGIVVFIVGLIMWKTGGIDKYFTYESFTITNQPMDGINDLEIKVGGAQLVIKKGGEKLDVVAENLPEDEYIYGTQDGKFYLKRKSGFEFIYPSIIGLLSDKNTDPKITITLPDKEYNKVEIAVGAGTADIDGLTARNADISVGAGEMTARDFKVTGELDIDLGTGESTFENFDANKVDLDTGIGQTNFSGSVYGGMEADCGIGEVNITIFGRSSDYDIDVDSGIGSINVNRNSSGRGDIPMNINGGIGEVNVTFIDR